MAKGLFIIGTDTDVGKTFVTAGITYILRKHNLNACSFKPVQSGGILKENKVISGDIEFIKNITEINETNQMMNSYCLKESVSPHIASEIENITIDKNKIIKDYKILQEKYDYVVVEGAGGTIVPIIRDRYYIYDLIKDLNIPVVIVARAGVGTINHTVLTINFLKNKGIEVKGIIINEYSNSYYEDDNIKVIKNITGVDVISIINKLKIEDDKEFVLKARDEYSKSLEINKILSLF